jgi:hypothetical protein
VTTEHIAGALSLPLSVVTDEATGAPTTTALLAEFRKAIEELCGTAWSALYPAEPIIRSVYARDPTEGDFLANDLPALFLWGHDDQEVEQLTDDIRITTDNLSLMWLPHPAPDMQAQLTSQFWQAISKAIRLVSGKHGSSLYNTANAWGGDLCTRLGLYDLTIGRGEPTEVRIQAGEEVFSFTAIMWQVTVRETIGTPITSPAQPISAPALRTTYQLGGEDPLTVAESWHPKP